MSHQSEDQANGQAPAKPRGLQGSGVAYPVETVDEMIEIAVKIVSENGTTAPISKESIAATLNRKVASLNLHYSTLGQYGIFNLVHGKGYQPTPLYKKYTEPVYDNDQHTAKLQMFQNAPLYSKIIENLNGHVLPPEDKFPNLLKGGPFNVNANSAERAARVFFENIRQLKLLAPNNKFVFSLDNSAVVNPEQVKVQPPAQGHEALPKSPELVRLPIHLPGDGNRVAYFDYPKNLTKRDFKIIAKALTFIASSVITSEDNEDYELLIEVNEKKGEGRSSP